MYFISVFFTTLGITSLVMTRLAIFQGHLALLVSFVFGTLVAYWRQEGRDSRQFLPIIAGLLAFAYVTAFPLAELDAGVDNGVYTILAHTIATNGYASVNYSPIYEATAIVGSENVGNYPGIYPSPGEPHFQFNHMTAAIRAVFVDVFNQRQIALSSASIALVAVFAFASLCLLLLPVTWSIFATALFLLNAAVLYTAKSSLSEMASVAYFCIGVIFLIRTFRSDALIDVVMAGVGFGCVMLSRVDGYLTAPFVAAGAVMMVLDKRQRVWPALTLLAIFVGFAGWSLVDTYTYSTAYFQTLWPIGIRGATGGAAVIILAALTLCIAGGISAPAHAYMQWLATRFGVFAVAAVCIIGMSVASILILRSIVLDQSAYDLYEAFYKVRAAREFTWYSTVPLLFFALLSPLIIARRNLRAGIVVGVPAVTLIILSIAYARITPVHPWGARRWVPYALPMVVLLGTYTMHRILERWRISGFALIITVTALYAYSQDRIAREYWFGPDQRSLSTGYDRLAAALLKDGASLYMTPDRPSATILTYLYGIPTAPLNGFLDRGPVAIVDGLPQVCGPRMDWVSGSRSEVEWFGKVVTAPEHCTGAIFYKQSNKRLEDTFPYSLLEGWNRREEWGAWASQREVTLKVRPSEGSSRVSLDVFAFLTKDAPTFNGAIYLDGKQMADFSFTLAQARKTVSFSLPPSSPDEIILTIRTDPTRSPLSLGVSTDPRDLGVALAGIHFE